MVIHRQYIKYQMNCIYRMIRFLQLWKRREPMEESRLTGHYHRRLEPVSFHCRGQIWGMVEIKRVAYGCAFFDGSTILHLSVSRSNIVIKWA